jgi:hypothetical protein
LGELAHLLVVSASAKQVTCLRPAPSCGIVAFEDRRVKPDSEVYRQENDGFPL